MASYYEINSRRVHLDVSSRHASKIVLGIDDTRLVHEGDRSMMDYLVLKGGEKAREAKCPVTYIGCDGKFLFTVYPPT